MDEKKTFWTPLAQAVLIITISIWLPASSSAVEPQWTNLTSLGQINSFLAVNDTMYVATSGGLMLLTDLSEPAEVLGALEGLGTSDISDLIIDQDNMIWVTGFGRLINISADNPRQYLFFDNDNKLYDLHAVTNDDDKLWIGSELGLLLFSKSVDGGLIQDSYTLFGGFNPGPDVWQILLVGDSIYLATSEGLAIGDRTMPNLLKSPSNWETFGPGQFPELGTGDVRKVVTFDSKIYIASENGLFVLSRQPDLLTEVNLGAEADCTDLLVRNDTLWAYCDIGLGVITTGTVALQTLPGLPASAKNGIQFGSSQLIGTDGGGLYWRASGDFERYPYTGAPANFVSGLGVGTDGRLTAGFVHQPIGQFDNNSWTEHDLWLSNGSTNVSTDSSGAAWVGTWGGGLYRIADDTTQLFNRTNSTLVGNPEGNSYIVIRGLDNDGRYLFAGAYRAFDGNSIVIADLSNLNSPDGWTTLGVDDGLTNTFVATLDYQDGWLAVGTDAGGVYLCFIGPDPFDKSDDFCVHLTEENDRLLSDVIRQVKFDPSGTLWVATNFGLSRFNIGFEWFDDVVLPGKIGPDIAAIAFDSRGNIWAGAVNGLAFLNVSTNEGERFTSINSGLVSDKVRALTYDGRTGQLYVATEAGISIVSSFISRPAYDISLGYPFPNPFVIRSGDDRLEFNYARAGTVRIHNVAGEQVIEISSNAGWDGTNRAGDPVAAGLYIYLYTAPDGSQELGKFLLVRD